MSGNFIYVVALIFLFAFIRFMVGIYDSDLAKFNPNSENLCSEDIRTLNENVSYPITGISAQSTDLWGWITGFKCTKMNTGMVWFATLIYGPIIAGLIYLFVPIPFRGS
jgi:hypothetical protein